MFRGWICFRDVTLVAIQLVAFKAILLWKEYPSQECGGYQTSCMTRIIYHGNYGILA